MRLLPALPATASLIFVIACSPAPPPVPANKAVAKPPETPPPSYRVHFDTPKGPFVVEVKREWAPLAADRFYTLTRDGFFDEARFFRVVRKFVAQFGVHRDPEIQALWNMKAPLDDDKRVLENKRGTLSFAKLGPKSRRTQVFINLSDNKALDAEGFVPFGKIIEGLSVIDELYAKYGETANRGGGGPDPRILETQGNAYLIRLFGSLDYIKRASIDQPAN
jgi:peptidyl-prolyl cis-trans isomerase A (cyclophilin A)